MRVVYSCLDHADQLFREVSFDATLPNVPAISNIHDIPNKLNNNFSFLDNPDNPFQQPNFRQALLLHLAKTNSARRFWMGEKLNSDGHIQWNRNQVNHWNKKVDELGQWLLAAYHLSSGMPARATEIAAFTYRNTPTKSRNLFVSKGKSCLYTVQTYHKCQNAVGSTKTIPRFLEGRLGRLLLASLVFIRPFQERLAEELGDTEKSTDLRRFLFVKNGHRMDGEDVSNAINFAFNTVLQKNIQFSQVRHVLVAFVRSQIKRSLIPDLGMILPIAAQAGHSEETEERIYGRLGSDEPYTTSAEEFTRYWILSTMWHQLLGLSMDKVVISPTQQSKSTCPGKLPITTQITGFSIAEQPSLSIKPTILPPSTPLTSNLSPIAPRVASQVFEAVPTPTATVTINQKFIVPYGQLQPSYDSCTGTLDNDRLQYLLFGLRALLKNEQATFRSREQLLACHKIIEREDDLIVVLPV
jgi:hypothetical protein